MFEILEEQLRREAGRLRREMPELQVHSWSHSVGELTEMDGWSLGFEVSGLANPMEVEVCYHHIHSMPELVRAEAVWVIEGEVWGWNVFRLETQVQGDPPLRVSEPGMALLRESLDLALRNGPAEPDRAGACVAVPTSYQPPQPEVRLIPLEAAESAIYKAWKRYLGELGFEPVKFLPMPECFPYHPSNPEQCRAMTTFMPTHLGDALALVRALFPGETLSADCPEFSPVEGPTLQPGWRSFRQLYSRHPRAHGLMALGRVGVSGDRATMLVCAVTGASVQRHNDGLPLLPLSTGLSLVHFQARDGQWCFSDWQLLSHDLLTEIGLRGCLWLHFAGRVQFQAVARDARWRMQVQLETIGEVQIFSSFHLPRGARGFRCDCPTMVVFTLHYQDVIPALEAALEQPGSEPEEQSCQLQCPLLQSEIGDWACVEAVTVERGQVIEALLLTPQGRYRALLVQRLPSPIQRPLNFPQSTLWVLGERLSGHALLEAWHNPLSSQA